jgi:hypothetical protein
LKAYFDNFPSENESIGLNDPIYKGWFFFSHIFFVFLFGVTLVLLVSLTPIKWRITILHDSKSVLSVSHDNWYLCIYLFNSLFLLFSLHLFSTSHLKMDTTLEKLRNYFPALSQNAITKIKVVNEPWNSWRYSLANWSKGPIIRWVLQFFHFIHAWNR